MSYSVSGVAAIPFPIQTLQSDAYGVPGSQRAIQPHTTSELTANYTPGKAVEQAEPAAGTVKGSVPKQNTPVDTVTLTTTGKVLKLQREGESTAQIAASLNLPAKEVQSDLHIEDHAAQSFTVAPIVTPLSGNTAKIGA